MAFCPVAFCPGGLLSWSLYERKSINKHGMSSTQVIKTTRVVFLSEARDYNYYYCNNYYYYY